MKWQSPPMINNILIKLLDNSDIKIYANCSKWFLIYSKNYGAILFTWSFILFQSCTFSREIVAISDHEDRKLSTYAIFYKNIVYKNIKAQISEM